MNNYQLGGLKTKEKLLAKDPDYYVKLGKLGGPKAEKTYLKKNPEEAKKIGKKGGSVSKRGMKYLGEDRYWRYYSKEGNERTIAFNKASGRRKEVESK